MGVRPYKDSQGRTRYRVTFSRNGRRLVDERLPAGTPKEKADQYSARIVTEWFNRERLGLQKVPLISEVIQQYEIRRKPNLKVPRNATHNVQAVAEHVIGKTLEQLPEVAAAVVKAQSMNSETTIWQRVAFLKTLAKCAIKWGMTDRDFGVTIENPKPDNARHNYIGKEDLAKILRHASKPVRRAAWQLFYTGMRRGELFAAKVSEGCYSVPTTKNGDPRIIPIPEAVSRFAGNPTITRNPLSRSFKRACKLAGYGHLTLHDLRHSTASQLLNAGIDLRLVGMILGHRNPHSTNRYAHLAVKTHRDALNFAARQRQVYDKQEGLSGRRSTSPQKKRA